MELNIIRHHPDDAGLIGSVHLLPHWMLKGHQAILAVDIGGTNIRVGVVELNTQKAKNFAHAKVGKSHVWRHADDEPNRTTCVEKVAAMLRHMVEYARKKKLDLAPAVGIACPGIIEETGSITRGAQNLPGATGRAKASTCPRSCDVRYRRLETKTVFSSCTMTPSYKGCRSFPFSMMHKTGAY